MRNNFDDELEKLGFKIYKDNQRICGHKKENGKNLSFVSVGGYTKDFRMYLEGVIKFNGRILESNQIKTIYTLIKK